MQGEGEMEKGRKEANIKQTNMSICCVQCVFALHLLVQKYPTDFQGYSLQGVCVAFTEAELIAFANELTEIQFNYSFYQITAHRVKCSFAIL